jgi:hypothetical protein
MGASTSHKLWASTAFYRERFTLAFLLMKQVRLKYFLYDVINFFYRPAFQSFANLKRIIVIAQFWVIIVTKIHSITPKLIITTTYCKSTIDSVRSAVGSLNMLPKDSSLRWKHVAHKHKMHIYFSDI